MSVGSRVYGPIVFDNEGAMSLYMVGKRGVCEWVRKGGGEGVCVSGCGGGGVRDVSEWGKGRRWGEESM